MPTFVEKLRTLRSRATQGRIGRAEGNSLVKSLCAELIAATEASTPEIAKELAAIDEALGPKPWRTDMDGNPADCTRAQAIRDWIAAAGAEGDEATRRGEVIATLAAKIESLQEALSELRQSQSVQDVLSGTTELPDHAHDGTLNRE